MLQLIMNIANSNNNRKNENNNNNNDNNNNNINEGITLLLNEYTNEVMATGNGVGRELFTDDDFEVKGMKRKTLSRNNEKPKLKRRPLTTCYIHTSYLSFFLHGHYFWLNFSPHNSA